MNCTCAHESQNDLPRTKHCISACLDETQDCIKTPEPNQTELILDLAEKIEQKQRPDWVKIWLDLAASIGARSTDLKHRVGCVIVSEDNTRVLALGYNQDHKGGSNKRKSMDHGQSGFIHAEINALVKLNPSESCKKIMYLTLSPCYPCAQLIINAGIDAVYYNKRYTDEEAFVILEKAGIPTFYVDDYL